MKTAPSRDDAPRPGPGPARRAIFAGLALVALAGFIALGTWQLQRRIWKLDLIARVEQRVHAAPAPAPAPPPGQARWPSVSAAADEYRHVAIQGAFLNERETLVQASTGLGSGFWVMTPLRTADGGIVMINRGFVTPAAAKSLHAADAQPAGAGAPAVTVTGLLRMSQPGGGFLRRNDAAANRWFSRDVQAIAAARGLDLRRVAPYFIDADADANADAHADKHAGAEAENDAGRRPVGGLTVIVFPNNHLVYALTWYALALMTAAALLRSLRMRPEPPILREKHRRGEREGEDNGDAGNVR